jgi:hypothetical protein
MRHWHMIGRTLQAGVVCLSAQRRSTMDHALERCCCNEELWCIAVLLRTKGEILLRKRAADAPAVARPCAIYRDLPRTEQGVQILPIASLARSRGPCSARRGSQRDTFLPCSPGRFVPVEMRASSARLDGAPLAGVRLLPSDHGINFFARPLLSMRRFACSLSRELVRDLRFRPQIGSAMGRCVGVVTGVVACCVSNYASEFKRTTHNRCRMRGSKAQGQRPRAVAARTTAMTSARRSMPSPKGCPKKIRRTPRIGATAPMTP